MNQAPYTGRTRKAKTTMKTSATLDASAASKNINGTTTTPHGRSNKPTGINAPLPSSGRIKPAGLAPTEHKGKGKGPEPEIGKRNLEAEKQLKEAGAKAKAAKNAGIGQVAVTPPESVSIYKQYRPVFTEACLAWLVLGKTGQMRVADVPVIAIHLMSKRSKYLLNEIPVSLWGTDKEKELREEAKDTLKTMRKTWKALSPEKRAEWLDKAKPVFNRTLREYLKKVAPLKKAFEDKRFVVSRAVVHMTKKGIVHVGKQATHRPEVATA